MYKNKSNLKKTLKDVGGLLRMHTREAYEDIKEATKGDWKRTKEEIGVGDG